MKENVFLSTLGIRRCILGFYFTFSLQIIEPKTIAIMVLDTDRNSMRIFIIIGYSYFCRINRMCFCSEENIELETVTRMIAMNSTGHCKNFVFCFSYLWHITSISIYGYLSRLFAVAIYGGVWIEDVELANDNRPRVVNGKLKF